MKKIAHKKSGSSIQWESITLEILSHYEKRFAKLMPALELRSRVLEKLYRTTFRSRAQSLKFLALCCPVEVTVHTLPPYDALPQRFRAAKAVRRQYRDFKESTNGPRIVMLSDAFALLCIFEKARRPEDAEALAELTEVTKGLRTALQRVQDTSG